MAFTFFLSFLHHICKDRLAILHPSPFLLRKLECGAQDAVQCAATRNQTGVVQQKTKAPAQGILCLLCQSCPAGLPGVTRTPPILPCGEERHGPPPPKQGLVYNPRTPQSPARWEQSHGTGGRPFGPSPAPPLRGAFHHPWAAAVLSPPL